MRIVRRSPYDNIYHCCTQKTASQWLRAVFSDPIVYRYTGLDVFPFAQLVDRLQDARFDSPLPKRTIGAHLYIDYPTYLTIPKPSRYRTFFVLRDPRDIVVSWYFSVKYSHPPVGLTRELRRELDSLSLEDGLRFSIGKLAETGIFWTQRSWQQVSGRNENVVTFRYEHLAADNCAFLRTLFGYLGLEIPRKEFLLLCDRHSFEHCSGGRKQGEEDPLSHYRSGSAGDWRRYFCKETIAHFRDVTGDLLDVIGYA